jgi:hypothetical protein
MKKLLLVMCICVGLAACVTETETSPYLIVETVPSGALLSFPDGTTCETPCPVYISEPLTMRVAKAGFLSVTRDLAPGMTGRTTIILELAAPTMEIEESTLPDL